MSYLFPPLEIEHDENGRKNILSPLLMENFKILQSTPRKKRAREKTIGIPTDTFRKSIKLESSGVNRSKLTLREFERFNNGDDTAEDEWDNANFERAVITAFTAEKEIAELSNGIKELEALLNEDNRDESNTPFSVETCTEKTVSGKTER